MSEIRSFLYSDTELESKHLLLGDAVLVDPIEIDGHTEKFGVSQISITGSSQVLPEIQEGGILYDVDSKISYKVIVAGAVQSKADNRIVQYNLHVRFLQEWEVAS